MSEAPAPFSGVLETCVYYRPEQAEAMRALYVETLGLRPVSSWPGGLALRVGAGVVLLFDREELDRRESPIADHGPTGPGHVCLLAADPNQYDRWRQRLGAAGVEITHEHDWEGGRRSLYFHDPAGNLLEIADRDLWPR